MCFSSGGGCSPNCTKRMPLWWERRTRWQCETMSLHCMICEPKSSASLSPARVATSKIIRSLRWKPWNKDMFRSWNCQHRIAVKQTYIQIVYAVIQLESLTSITTVTPMPFKKEYVVVWFQCYAAFKCWWMIAMNKHQHMEDQGLCGSTQKVPRRLTPRARKRPQTENKIILRH